MDHFAFLQLHLYGHTKNLGYLEGTFVVTVSKIITVLYITHRLYMFKAIYLICVNVCRIIPLYLNMTCATLYDVMWICHTSTRTYVKLFSIVRSYQEILGIQLVYRSIRLTEFYKRVENSWVESSADQITFAHGHVVLFL